MNKKNFIKLARLIAKFAEVNTDRGVLIYDGELSEGVEVTNEEGEAVEDGEYKLEDGRVVVVVESKIAEVKVPEEEAVVEEALEEVEAPVDPVDPKDEEIEDLKRQLEEKDATIAALESRIKELEDAEEAPVEDPLELKQSAQQPTRRSGALKYFN